MVLPSQKFAQLSGWYQRWQEIKMYKSGLAS